MIQYTDSGIIQTYIEDTSNIQGRCEALYIPECQDELIELLRGFSNSKTPVTLAGGGTGTTGSRIPLDGISLSLERLNRIISIDSERQIISLESGVSLDAAEKELNKQGLTIRAQPTEPLAFAGGIVATCASGQRSFKYGSIRKYIFRLKLVLSDGFVMDIRRGEIFACRRGFDFKYNKRRFVFDLPDYVMPGVKHAAGYFVDDNMDLIDLFIGQEGTLACILEMDIKVQKSADSFFDCVVFYRNESGAFEFVKKMQQRRAGDESVYPCSLEFFDHNALDIMRKENPSIPEKTCAVYFEQDLDGQKEEPIIEEYTVLLETTGALIDSVWLASNDSQRQKLRRFRHSLPQAVNEYLRTAKTRKTATDIAVPLDRFQQMYEYYAETGKLSGMPYINFGHIGQAHLHFNFLPADQLQQAGMLEYVKQIVQKAIDLGGTVSAEHGIGKTKKEYLKMLYGEKAIKQMAAVKKVFDPACILNLDNIFDREYLFADETKKQ